MNRKLLAGIVGFLGTVLAFIWLYFFFDSNQTLAFIGWFVIMIPVIAAVCLIEGKEYFQREKEDKARLQNLFSTDGCVIELYFISFGKPYDLSQISPKKKKFGVTLYENVTADDIAKYNVTDDDALLEKIMDKMIGSRHLSALELMNLRNKQIVVEKELYEKMRREYSFNEFLAGKEFTVYEIKG